MIIRQWKDVIDGRKTQTRRVIDLSRTRLVLTNGDVWNASEYTPFEDGIESIQIQHTGLSYRTRWQVGKVYAMVPKMGKPGVGFYRITSLCVERLQDIPFDDAIAEGIWSVPMSKVLFPSYECSVLPGEYHPTPEDCYRALWESINGATPGARWRDNPWVVAVGIEYAGDTRHDSK